MRFRYVCCIIAMALVGTYILADLTGTVVLAWAILTTGLTNAVR